jgi:hypothetical protein
MVHLSISDKEKECLCSAQHPDRRWGHVKKNVTDEGRRWEKKLKRWSSENRQADGDNWLLSDSHIVGISTE